MSYYQKVLEQASAAKVFLGSARHEIIKFILSQQNADGGFRGRTEQSDIYYSGFAVDCLLALDHDFDASPIIKYLQSQKDLDLIHLSALIRILYRLDALDLFDKADLVRQIEHYSVAGDGYSTLLNQSEGSSYGTFLALVSLQALGVKTQPTIANALNIDISSVNVPALVSTLMARKILAIPTNPNFYKLILKNYDQRGGFLASSQTADPDLLSTAIGLYGLDLGGISIGHKEQIIDFVAGMWDEKGGFRGNWHDNIVDSEYTFYGILALGMAELK